jgi:DNA modification methylase
LVKSGSYFCVQGGFAIMIRTEKWKPSPDDPGKRVYDGQRTAKAVLAPGKIYNMDCLEGLKLLDGDSIQMAVTSPPYWALRDYGVPGQIGQEDSPAEYVERLCAVFAEVYRVLKPDGTFWLNISDTYCGTGSKGTHFDPKNPKGRTGQKKAKNRQLPGLKPKDLIGIPWRIAFALRGAGWYLRQEIIWSKPNAMPESVTDRCVKAHESVFLFAKSRRYYFDHKAIREPAGSYNRQSKRPEMPYKYGVAVVPGSTAQNLNIKKKDVYQSDSDGRPMRSKRSVWSSPTHPLKDGHYAAFPRALAEPCILAGCPPGGIVLDPFMGSGTTAMAAAALGRQYIGFELNPEYIAIAEKRIREGK